MLCQFKTNWSGLPIAVKQALFMVKTIISMALSDKPFSISLVIYSQLYYNSMLQFLAISMATCSIVMP